MSEPYEEELDFQKGDYVALKENGESGRIIGAGTKPGFWLVRFDRAGEKEETAQDRLEHTY
jgi:hypothetical protein